MAPEVIKARDSASVPLPTPGHTGDATELGPFIFECVNFGAQDIYSGHHSRPCWFPLQPLYAHVKNRGRGWSILFPIVGLVCSIVLNRSLQAIMQIDAGFPAPHFGNFTIARIAVSDINQSHCRRKGHICQRTFAGQPNQLFGKMSLVTGSGLPKL